MDKDTELRCARPGCGHGYGMHWPLLSGARGHCARAADPGVLCSCTGFLWVPPAATDQPPARMP